jgi:hypothetical protein
VVVQPDGIGLVDSVADALLLGWARLYDFQFGEIGVADFCSEDVDGGVGLVEVVAEE